MMSASAFSHAIEMAGIMSVPRSTHRMRMVERGRGTWMVMNARKGEISGMLEESVYAIDFFRLSKMSLPSSTPATMDTSCIEEDCLPPPWRRQSP